MHIVEIDGSDIASERAFHRVFAEKLGFPGFYGENMNAWIDCMSYIDDPEAGMSTVHVRPGEVLAIRITNASVIERRCPRALKDLLECSAAVNERFWSRGDATAIAVALA
jgi:RNAse (barnase) inhibitor barstar